MDGVRLRAFLGEVEGVRLETELVVEGRKAGGEGDGGGGRWEGEGFAGYGEG